MAKKGKREGLSMGWLAFWTVLCFPIALLYYASYHKGSK